MDIFSLLITEYSTIAFPVVLFLCARSRKLMCDDLSQSVLISLFYLHRFQTLFSAYHEFNCMQKMIQSSAHLYKLRAYPFYL